MPKRDLPILTRAESEVMQALWDAQAATVQELLPRLPKKVAYTTALTIVRILEQKGYVTHEPHPAGGRAHLYRPAVARQPVRRRHVRDLVDRLFGGDPEALVAGLLEDESLDPEELQALRRRIDERLGKGKKR